MPAPAPPLVPRRNRLIVVIGTPAERVRARVDFAGPVPAHAPELGRCHLWTGPVDRGGYAQITVGPRNRRELIHRVIYADAYGPIPPGMHVHHRCHDWRTCPPGPCLHRRCVAPRHLEAITPASNIRDGGGLAGHNARKTWCAGRHGPHDLTDPANVYIHPTRGSRHCRPCERARRADRAGPDQLVLVD